ncbi:MAG: hypothetical protein Q7R97_00040 [Candidatus Daviesbacteria bacterium]|nr:hypothetical protein [Candidatus Daviesbacteria bacterium]
MPENTNSSILPPPSGSPEQAQKYLEKLIGLLDQEKVLVTHTDLSKLDPSSLQDHYYITLNDYHVEVSHTKKADTGEDFYVLLFNNLKQVRDGCSEKVILAYMNFTSEQFEEFKKSAKVQLDKIKAREDAKRFAEAMEPIDQALENLNNSSSILETPVAEISEPAPEPEPQLPEITIPETHVSDIPIFNEPIPEPVSQSTPQNLSPQTPTI